MPEGSLLVCEKTGTYGFDPLRLASDILEDLRTFDVGGKGDCLFLPLPEENYEFCEFHTSLPVSPWARGRNCLSCSLSLSGRYYTGRRIGAVTSEPALAA
jgi:hypothetical protein